MIGRPLGKLGPPAVEKGTAQHGQGEEEHERRSKNQHLHDARPLAPGQRSQPQAPGTAGLHPEHPPTPEQGKGEHRKEGRGAPKA